MRRAAALLAGVSVVAGAAPAVARAPVVASAVVGGAEAASPALARAPVAIGIAQHEYRISTYRKVVRRGPVKLNITNLGEDTHNLVVKGPRRFRADGPDVEPGERASMPLRLRRPGKYLLLCTRANHLSLGMRAKLRVRR